ncbi:MAG: PPOX class F420-dependent oxidoreductase [Actinomycetota bacterium]
MSEEEYRAFLMEDTRTGKLATVRRNFRAHVVPIWFVLDEEGRLIFTTGKTSVKGQNLRRDLHVSICVDDERPPYSFVQVDGVADLSEDPDALLEWATRIAERYMGPELAEEYGRRNAVPGEVLVRVTPTSVIAQADLAD